MKERRKEGLRSRQERIANEILMHFRAQRKLQGEVSLSDSLEGDGDGGSLSLMDVLSVDDDMLEELDNRDTCIQVRRCVERCLTDRERDIVVRRYGLDGRPPMTQREIAAERGISRSYVSRIEKRALEKLKAALEAGEGGGADVRSPPPPFSFSLVYHAPARESTRRTLPRLQRRLQLLQGPLLNAGYIATRLL